MNTDEPISPESSSQHIAAEILSGLPELNVAQSDERATGFARRKISEAGRFVARVLRGSLEQDLDEQKANTDLNFSFVAAHVDEYLGLIEGKKPDDETMNAARSAIGGYEHSKVNEYLGYVPMQFRGSAEDDSRFSKENDPDLFPNLEGKEKAFRVLVDREGSEWLMKDARRGTNKLNAMALNRDLNSLLILQRGDEEVIAYQVANRLNYPAPETRLVTATGLPDNDEANGRAFIAYRYVRNALFYKGFYQFAQYPESKIAAARRVIENQPDIDFRPVYNFMIGCYFDGSEQGIVDQATGIYYAQDLDIDSKMKVEDVNAAMQLSKDEAFMRIRGKVVKFKFEPFINDVNRLVAAGYFDRLDELDEEELSKIVQPSTPLYREKKAQLVKAMASRAKLLVAMYKRGDFEQDNFIKRDAI